MNARTSCFPWIVVVVLLAGIGQAAPTEFFRDKIRMQDRNEGYTLLYQLADSESDVGKLFIVKSANTNVTALVREICESAAKVRDQLNLFARKDRYLRLNEVHLPLMEDRTRDSIEVATRNELLFSAGANFEGRLLYTQAQAMQYGSHLARHLRDTENNDERREYLGGIAKKWDDYYQRVMKLLLPKE